MEVLNDELAVADFDGDLLAVFEAGVAQPLASHSEMWKNDTVRDVLSLPPFAVDC